jgi:hypothetical protein
MLAQPTEFSRQSFSESKKNSAKSFTLPLPSPSYRSPHQPASKRFPGANFTDCNFEYRGWNSCIDLLLATMPTINTSAFPPG